MYPVDGQAAFIGLGSNLDDPVRQVRTALDDLETIPQSSLEGRSPLFRSPPMGPRDQPDYVNAVAALRTGLTPVDLLTHLQRIEDAHGRERRAQKWGPRTLDLDILLFGDLVSDDPGLIIPHPGLTSRNFVVYPLLRIAPNLVLPDGRTLEGVAAGLTMDGLEEIMEEEEASERQSA